MGKKKTTAKVPGPMEENVSKMDAQLKLWAAQIDVLATKTEKAGAQVETEFRQSIDDLKARHAEAQPMVKKYEETGSEKWEGFKTDIDRAWGDVEDAFRNLNRP